MIGAEENAETTTATTVGETTDSPTAAMTGDVMTAATAAEEATTDEEVTEETTDAAMTATANLATTAIPTASLAKTRKPPPHPLLQPAKP
jgi:hypothetical protein